MNTQMKSGGENETENRNVPKKKQPRKELFGNKIEDNKIFKNDIAFWQANERTHSQSRTPISQPQTNIIFLLTQNLRSRRVFFCVCGWSVILYRIWPNWELREMKWAYWNGKPERDAKQELKRAHTSIAVSNAVKGAIKKRKWWNFQCEKMDFRRLQPECIWMNFFIFRFFRHTANYHKNCEWPHDSILKRAS